ncbi:MAG: TatD family hydrolase [Immundisolibacteraceae bacterium]|nr:TatD family hydrolase [Immundisolibacteraceae bacterium]
MYIDSHCHLDDARFDLHQAELIADASAVGVEQIVVPSVWSTHWGAVAGLADHFDGVHGAYGLHPWFLASAANDPDENQADDLIRQLDDWLCNHSAVAVGECGLDFSRRFDEAQRALQQPLFQAQIELAQRHQLPLIIHGHKALDRVIHLLSRYSGARGVVHRFDGSLQQAQQLIEMGFFIGVAAGITFPRQRRLRQVIAQLPVTSLLLETDAPDLPPAGSSGSLNQPSLLPKIADVLAELLASTRAEVAAQTSENSRKLFGI